MFLFNIISVIVIGCLVIFAPEIYKKIYNKINKIRSRKIVEFKNANGKIYYELIINNKSYGLKMLSYDDALFFYNNIKDISSVYYVYESLGENPYRIITLTDDVSIIFVPYFVKNLNDLSCHYRNHDKSTFFGNNNWSDYKSIEHIYNNIHYSSKVIISSKDDIEDKIESAVNNSDIKKLKEIVNEYKETVNLQNAMTNMLVKICESDKKYSKK